MRGGEIIIYQVAKKTKSYVIRSCQMLSKIILLLCILAISIHGESHPSISLHSFVSSVTDASNDIHILKKEHDIKKADHQIAIAELFPKVNTEFSLDSKDYNVDGRDPLASITVLGEDIDVFPIAPSKYSSRFDISMTQTLFAGGRIFAQIQLAELDVKRSWLGYRKELSSVQSSAAYLYWTTLLAKYEWEYATQLENLIKKKQGLLKRKQTKGFLNKKKLRESNIQLSNQEAEAEFQLKSYKKAKAKLSRSMGKSSNNLKLITTPAKSSMSNFFNELKQSSLSFESIDSKQANLQIQIQEKQQVIGRSPFFPNVSLKAGIDYFDSSNELNSAINNFKQGNSYILLAVQYNLFSGFKDSANLRKVNINKQIAQLSLKKTQDHSLESVEKQIQTCQRALTRLNKSKLNLESMKQLLSEAMLQFKYNQISQEEIIETQIQVEESSFLHNRALIQAEIALHEFAFFIGEGTRYLRRYQ